MKLSEAMREGAKLRPQGFGSYFQPVAGDFFSCAIGAAYEGIVGKLDKRPDYMRSETIEHEAAFDMFDVEVINPVRNIRRNLHETIACLNDDEKWTREQIADWLETIGY